MSNILKARRIRRENIDTMEEKDLQVLKDLSAPFPGSQIKPRKGARRKKFMYIPVHFIRERLDQVLNINWDWEIIETKNTTFSQKGKEVPGVVVTGRLTVYLPSGAVRFRDGNGGSDCSKGMGPGDAEKIAASNALKRAAWMFGIGKEFGLGSEDAVDDTTYFQPNSPGTGGSQIPGVVNSPALPNAAGQPLGVTFTPGTAPPQTSTGGNLLPGSAWK